MSRALTDESGRTAHSCIWPIKKLPESQRSRPSEIPGVLIFKLRLSSACAGNPNSAMLRLGSAQFRNAKLCLVVDQLIGFVVPAVQLTDLSTDLL